MPLGVDALAQREGRQRGDTPRLDLEECQAIVARLERIGLSREPIGHECDAPTVGRPCRLEVGEQVAGQSSRCARVEVVYEQIRVSAHGCRECDRFAIRRPCRVQDLSDLRHFDLARDIAIRDAQDGQHRRAGMHPPDDKLPAVGTPGSRRANELQSGEMLVQRRIDELPHYPSCRGFRKKEVDGEQITRREKDNVPAVRADGWRHVGCHPRLVAGGQRSPKRVSASRCAHDRRVLIANCRMPRRRELFVLDQCGVLQREQRVAGAHRVTVNLTDQIITIFSADIRPDRLTPPIGKELAVIEIPYFGQLFPARRIAQPHRRMRVEGPDRQVLGQPLHEPEGQALDAAAATASRRTLGRNVVLECMHELVAKDMVSLLKRSCQWENHPALQSFGNAARSLRRSCRR